MPITVAIDGPAGAGKSTVARRLAAALGFTYIDTGAMYRAMALKVVRFSSRPETLSDVLNLAMTAQIELSPLLPDGTQTVTLDGDDVTTAIRTPEVSQATSQISAIPEIRSALVRRQREIGSAAHLGVVMEGRDIGTVVFPNAEVKVFLTASPEERARRRHEELTAGGIAVDYATVLSEQRERDARDSGRNISPLKPAADAVHLLTDGLSVDAVVEHILALVKERMETGEAVE